ncbi:chaperone NapD [Zhengella sp. ZM62]|uniref:chaperone NapD n=1 Tax=Zhengella sedimenti TaxID=3390035 RepID=UPI003977120D
MPDAPRYHVSSAIVSTKPGSQHAVLARLRGLQGIDVHAADGTRIIITIEGNSTGELGDRLTSIAVMEGVVAASMVFEHSEKEEEIRP